jgi:hypothetical protein
VLSNAAAAQDRHEVDHRIDAAISTHERERGGGPLGLLMHDREDPLRRGFPRLSILAGPFRFGGSSTVDSAPFMERATPVPDGPNPGGR